MLFPLHPLRISHLLTLCEYVLRKLRCKLFSFACCSVYLQLVVLWTIYCFCFTLLKCLHAFCSCCCWFVLLSLVMSPLQTPACSDDSYSQMTHIYILMHVRNVHLTTVIIVKCVCRFLHFM